jgi:hypothetical protein
MATAFVSRLFVSKMINLVFLSAFLGYFSSASPVPSPQSDLVNTVCRLNENDPASWGKTPASQFMDAWFAANGTTDWLRAMDQGTALTLVFSREARSPTNSAGTTNIPGFVSELDCKPLGGSACIVPTAPCQDFTPPELRLIRIAAFRAHDIFTQAQTAITVNVIDNILDIDKMISDFNPSSAAGNPDDTLKSIAAGFSIANKLLKGASGAAGDALGLIGAIFSFISATDAGAPNKVDLTQLKIQIEGQLKAVFDASIKQLAALNSKLMGGTDNINLDTILSLITSVGKSVGDPNAQNAITKIFSSGAFLAPPETSAISQGIADGLNLIKQGLVGGILKALNFYVYIDSTITDKSQCTATGSRFINGECFMVYQRTKPFASGKTDQQPINANTILKLDDPSQGYNINVEDFYNNINACNNGSPDPSNINLTDEYPKCFFSLPIIRNKGPNICSLLPSGANIDTQVPGIPANLDVTFSGCTRAICIGGFFGSGCP